MPGKAPGASSTGAALGPGTGGEPSSVAELATHGVQPAPELPQPALDPINGRDCTRCRDCWRECCGRAVSPVAVLLWRSLALSSVRDVGGMMQDQDGS